LWLRVNRRRASLDEYAATLAASGLEPTHHSLLPDALCLAPAPDLATLPGLAEGLISVQDGAAQLAVELLALQPGLRVLDACAAPGGKSAHALEREPALATLLALDDKPARTTRLRETLARLGLVADLREGDATAPAGWWDGKPFDRILIDAPCSGTGVIRRHPDIRLLRRASDLTGLVALQDRLLDALWPLLAPGGRLVYATCSILPAENDERIAAFVARTPAAVALDAVPAGFGRACAHGRQNLPGVDGMDGFYYAVLAHRG
jgi:16S rRNA (cytosine967-C5)-methyltransferase